MDDVTAARLNGAWIAVIGEDRPFQFNGEYRDGGTNQGYQMLYPAPNFAAFLAGVATHAALQSAQNDAHAEAQRRVSNEVLAPYQQVLDEIHVHEAFRRALQMRASRTEIELASTPHESYEPEVDLAAHAIMAQSRRALIVDLVARIRNPAAPDDDSQYVHKVRVISNPIKANGDAVDDYWLAAHGDRLKQTVSRLLARAIDLLIADATRQLTPAQNKQISARYQFGSERRTERANLLEQSCARQTLRTLRGWVLSVPVAEGFKSGASCPDGEVVSRQETPPA